MPTIVIPVAASTDDGDAYDNTFSATGTTVFFGTGGSGDQIGFFRFTLPASLTGATIGEADVTFDFDESYGTTINIKAVDQADAAAPTTWTDASTRPVTTAAVSWTTTPTGGGGFRTTPDIASVIQELVDSYTMGQGAHIVIYLDPRGTVSAITNEVASYDHATRFPASLSITYTAPTGASTSGILNAGGGLSAAVSQAFSRTVRAFPSLVEGLIGPSMQSGGGVTAAAVEGDPVLGLINTGGGIAATVYKATSVSGVLNAGGGVTYSGHDPSLSYVFVPPVRYAGGDGFERSKVSGGCIPHPFWKHYGSRFTLGYSVFITDGVGTPYPGRMVPSADQIRAADSGSGEGGRAWFRGGLSYTITAPERTILVAAGYGAYIT